MNRLRRHLEDLSYFQRLDTHGMLELLCEFPIQCEYAWAMGESFPLIRASAFDHIVFLGMGGSAIGGDLARSLFEEEIPLPIFVNRAYHLPRFVGPRSLVFAVSYSGNTEETLSGYEAARRRRARIIVVASGGKLIARAKKDGIPHLLLPSGLPPRTAVGYLFFIPYCIIRRLLGLGLKKNDFKEMLKTLNRLRTRAIGPEVPVSKNLSKKIALRLHGNLPAVYGSVQRIDAAVIRWRTQIAENAKHLCWTHFYPELNHNEIVGWREPKGLLRNLVIVLLRDAGDHPRIKRRMEITRGLIRREAGVETIEVESSGKSLLSRLFSLIYVGDFVSYYLAMLNRVDPTPVDRIERLKKQLAR